MKLKLCLFVKNHFYLLFLALIIVFACALNYKPNTFLIGWDTLHPEFDFLLNFKRIFLGVWREEQGLGALAVHAHMSDLPRVIFLWLSSLFLPVSFLRYFYFFLMLFLGPLGVYFFLKKEINLEDRASFLGGLFYLLNLGTVQHFYVPFEMFACLYGFLPWLLLMTAKYLAYGTRKNLFLFSLLTLLATPMAYASTLWFVYFISFVIYSLSLLSIKLKNIVSFKRLVVLFLATLIINSYWLLPNLYFLASSGKTVEQAKINQLFSEKAFLHDSKYATIENAAILKGFLFDWTEYQKGEFTYLLNLWQNHLRNPYILAIGYSFFALVLFGLGKAVVRRDKNGLSLLPLFLFSFVFLIHTNWPVSIFFNFLRDHWSLFKEALRFPWTKFSIIVIFVYSFYFAFILQSVFNLLKPKKLVSYFGFALAFLLLIVWTYPVFTGNLINKSKKIDIPKEYFEVFRWFKDQPSSQRIGVFPMPSFWGWEFYKWGFEGAGFIWFGLKQPVLVRDFDRWNPSNENYYWEASYALYSKNLTMLEKVLEKYQISWLILDENMINPAFPKAIFIDEFKEMIKNSDKIVEKQTYGGIHIYQVILKLPQENFVFLGQNLSIINPFYKWNNFDQAYFENGTYISDGDNAINSQKAYYPFRSLFTGKNQEDIEFQIEDRGDSFVIKNEIPSEYKDYILSIPSDNQELIFVDPENLGKIVSFSPQTRIADNHIEVVFPKIKGYYSAFIDPVKIADTESKENCYQFTNGKINTEIKQENFRQYLRLTAQDALNCHAWFALPNLSHQLAYLISVKNRHVAGEPPIFWIENTNLRKADLESPLFDLPKDTGNFDHWRYSYYLQPPMESDGFGYILHFDNRSIGQEISINDLGEISVNLIPYQYLTKIKLQSGDDQNSKPLFYIPNRVTHPHPSLYKIELPLTLNQQLTTLVLSQSYNPGWQGYSLDQKLKIKNETLRELLAPVIGERIKDHVLVNNWENGWQFLPTTNSQPLTTVYLVYLPQYLEYLGFGLLVLLFPSFFIFKKLLD